MAEEFFNGILGVLIVTAPLSAYFIIAAYISLIRKMVSLSFQIVGNYEIDSRYVRVLLNTTVIFLLAFCVPMVLIVLVIVLMCIWEKLLLTVLWLAGVLGVYGIVFT